MKTIVFTLHMNSKRFLCMVKHKSFLLKNLFPLNNLSVLIFQPAIHVKYIGQGNIFLTPKWNTLY